MKRRIPLLVSTLLALVATSTTANERSTLVLATYAYPKYDRAAALRPLADHLSARLAGPVDVVVHESPRALAEAIRAGRVDVAVTNTFVFLAVRSDPAVRASAVFDVPAATLDGYRGVLLARRERVPDVAALVRDAPMLRYAQVLPGSTSGGLVQDLHLTTLGVTSSHLPDRHDAGTHDAALARLVGGFADIAALAEEPWRRLRTQAPGDAANIVELWRSPPIPPGPVVCRESVRVACGDIARVLLALDRDAPAALASVAAAWSEAGGAQRMIPVDRAAYDALNADAPAARSVLDRALGQPAQPRASAYRQPRALKPRSGPPSQPMRALNT